MRIHSVCSSLAPMSISMCSSLIACASSCSPESECSEILSMHQRRKDFNCISLWLVILLESNFFSVLWQSCLSLVAASPKNLRRRVIFDH